MNPFHLNPSKTALVIVDLQRAVVGMATAPHHATDVVRKSAFLAKRLREIGGTVVYVRVDIADVLDLPVDTPYRRPNDSAPPPSASELVPEAGFEAGDLLITKRHWGAFAGTELEQLLRQRGIDTVILTGIATNFGVESTAREGCGLGFAFIIVEDACSALDVDSHGFAFKKIFPHLARVRNTDEVIALLG